ncbi:F-type H+-transporting ATPase subunit a [Desulfosalsimonas propionicica]|uniref:ATP synthase subunit a n=1 Tax=Desulfosalsimonas propionicica TaxID=332175 RepID=A0A7W0C9M8_9BACT|nr:F-type H+-transporting ATPase subunit a [Desulfosalsimonas propionicica]
MEHPFLIFVKLFEVIGLGHFAHEYPQVIYSWVVMAVLIILGAFGAKHITLIPNKVQNVFEMIISSLEEFTVDTAGEESRWFFPFLATIFLYIFLGNLAGLVPGFFSPTADLNTTLSCAIPVFFFTHYIGVKAHGLKYLKHFMGPFWWLAPIFIPIEIISHLSRVLSLSFRLFGNIMGKELVLAILFMLAGAFFAPLPIMALGVFVSFVQAFIFYLLSTMYFALAMEDDH